jgi:hypothetical protein
MDTWALHVMLKTLSQVQNMREDLRDSIANAVAHLHLKPAPSSAEQRTTGEHPEETPADAKQDH